MISNITLRPATVADLPVIVTLLHQMVSEDATADELQATPERLRETLFAPDPPAFILLACDGDTGEAVGYASYFRTYSTYLARPGLWLDDLFVVPDRRGQGIGQALFSEIARLVVAMDGGRLEWHANDVNERGLRFYARNGAETLDGIRTLRVDGGTLHALAGV